MRIACPGCAAEYEVPSASLNPRRKVRCTSCNAQWIPTAIEPPEAPAEPVASEPPLPVPNPGLFSETAMARLAAPLPPPRRSATLRAAWVLSVLILVGSAAAAVTWRGPVTRAWPASAWVLGMVDRVIPAAEQGPHPAAKAE